MELIFSVEEVEVMLSMLEVVDGMRRMQKLVEGIALDIACQVDQY